MQGRSGGKQLISHLVILEYRMYYLVVAVNT